MSQRLHIGKTDDDSYDCIIMDELDAREKLNREWFMRGTGMVAAPWKIRIADYDLWNKIEPIVTDIFTELGHQYPDCVWAFYDGNRCIEHPTRSELDEWLFRAQDI